MYHRKTIHTYIAIYIQNIYRGFPLNTTHSCSPIKIAAIKTKTRCNRSVKAKSIISHTASTDPNFKVPRNLSYNEHVPFLAIILSFISLNVKSLKKHL